MTLNNGRILIVLGVCFLVAALAIHLENTVFQSGAEKSRATVVVHADAIDLLDSSNNSETAVRFRDDNEEDRYAAVETWIQYKAGDKLDIYYDVSDPLNVRVDNFIERSAVKAVLCFLGFTLLFTGMMKAGTLGIRNGSLRIALSIDSAPLPLLERIGTIPLSGEVARRDINIVSQQTIRLTDPATGETRTYDSLDQVPPDRRAEIENAMNIGLNVSSRSNAGETYVFKNPDGSDAVYHSLDEMPPEIRKIFESLHRR